MVCFCDIPLSQIANHVNTYGRYGIGMKKDWGVLNRLNPVVYLSEYSHLDFKVRNLLDQHAPMLDVVNGTIEYLRGYVKPVKGSFAKQGRQFHDYHFYDEKEWRFIANHPHGEAKLA
jgi:hypothetical protein